MASLRCSTAMKAVCAHTTPDAIEIEIICQKPSQLQKVLWEPHLLLDVVVGVLACEAELIIMHEGPLFLQVSQQCAGRQAVQLPSRLRSGRVNSDASGERTLV